LSLSAASASLPISSRIFLYFNATLTPTQTFNPVDSTVPTNSIADFSITTGSAVSGGTIRQTFSLAGNSSTVIDLSSQKIILQPGDIVTIVAVADIGSNSVISASVNWIENT
jgi:hypothetical protein